MINIEQSDINEIKSAVGFPLVESLDFGDQTDNYIKNNAVKRVLRTYFTYFPIKVDTNTTVTGLFEISYPEANVYRMLRHFFNYKNINYANFSPFLLQSMIVSRGPSFRGYEQGYLEEAITRMSTEESIVDFTKAFRIADKPYDRKVEGYTNINGDVTIEWAKKSENFDDILYNYREDAIKLGKAYFMEDLYNLREQVKIATKIEINTSVFKETADRFREEVISKWSRRGFAVIVK